MRILDSRMGLMVEMDGKLTVDLVKEVVGTFSKLYILSAYAGASIVALNEKIIGSIFNLFESDTGYGVDIDSNVTNVKVGGENVLFSGRICIDLDIDELYIYYNHDLLSKYTIHDLLSLVLFSTMIINRIVIPFMVKENIVEELEMELEGEEPNGNINMENDEEEYSFFMAVPRLNNIEAMFRVNIRKKNGGYLLLQIGNTVHRIEKKHSDILFKVPCESCIKHVENDVMIVEYPFFHAIECKVKPHKINKVSMIALPIELKYG